MDSRPLSEEGQTFLMPWPFLDWPDILCAMDPVQEPTPPRLRALRRSGRLSRGVNVVQRGQRQLSGSATYSSCLWVWADRCERAGRPDEAAVARAGAADLESRFGHALRTFLAHAQLHELISAPFFRDAVQQTAEVLGRLSVVTEQVVAAGLVTHVDAVMAHVRGATPKFPEPVELEVPGLLGRLSPAVWVTAEARHSAVLVNVCPAAPVALSGEPARLFGWARIFDRLSWVELDQDPETLMSAVRYATGPAAPPTPERLDELFDAAVAGRLPIRRIRVAG